MFKTTMAAATLAALVLGLASTADAADKKKKNAAPATDVIFARLDANSDGKLTMEEFKNVLTEMQAGAKAKKPAGLVDLEQVFKKLDTNNDKSLSAAEFKNVTAAVAPAAPAKKAKKAKKVK